MSSHLRISRFAVLSLALALLPPAAFAKRPHLNLQVPSKISVAAVTGKSWTTLRGQSSMQGIALEWRKEQSPRSEVGLTVAPYYFRQPADWFAHGEEQVQALSTSLFLRRKFFVDNSMVPYAELSTGPMYATHQVPAKTARLNFITQVGGGVVLFSHSSLPVVLGYRFAHISNGGISGRNPGWNVSSFVIGLRLGR